MPQNLQSQEISFHKSSESYRIMKCVLLKLETVHLGHDHPKIMRTVSPKFTRRNMHYDQTLTCYNTR